MYKKVLMILHHSVLPHMSEPALMMDFLTAAYEMGEWDVAFVQLQNSVWFERVTLEFRSCSTTCE